MGLIYQTPEGRYQVQVRSYEASFTGLVPTEWETVEWFQYENRAIQRAKELEKDYQVVRVWKD